MLVGSWGPREEAEIDRKYLIRLAAAEDADTSPDGGPLVWSSFVPVTKPCSLALAADVGESIQLALEATESRVCGRQTRTLTIRPAARVYNYTRLPVRLAAIGFPFYHRLPPSSAPAGKRPAESEGVDLLKWQSDESSEAALQEGGGVVSLMSVTLCLKTNTRIDHDEGNETGGMLAPAALLTPRVVTHGTPTAPLPPCLRPLPRLRQQRLRPSQRI